MGRSSEESWYFARMGCFVGVYRHDFHVLIAMAMLGGIVGRQGRMDAVMLLILVAVRRQDVTGWPLSAMDSHLPIHFADARMVPLAVDVVEAHSTGSYLDMDFAGEFVILNWVACQVLVEASRPYYPLFL